MIIFLLALLVSAFTFKYTTALRKIRALKKRVHVIQGGTSAGKTFAILPIMIDKCIKTPGLEMSVVAESIPHLKKGALKDFKKIMKNTGRWIEKNYNATDRKYTFANGSYIEFFSPESVIGARRTHLFVNEANFISFEDYNQMAIRTSDEIWIDYNPSAEFWAHTELIPDEDSDFIILTYKDNEALPEALVREIEKKRDKAFKNPLLPLHELFNLNNIKDSYWANWWKVYGLGLVGTLEGVIFGQFKSINDFPDDCQWIGYGLDFGYTNDPTTLIKIGLKNGVIYLQQKFYKTGMLNSDIIKELKALGIKDEQIIADSSEPKTIAEIQLAGFNIVGAVKGADSINNGIAVMKEYVYAITSDSLELIKEWRTYSWKKNVATNKWTNEPQDVNNHAMDAIRYFIQFKIAAKPGTILGYGSTAEVKEIRPGHMSEKELEAYYQNLNNDE